MAHKAYQFIFGSFEDACHASKLNDLNGIRWVVNVLVIATLGCQPKMRYAQVKGEATAAAYRCVS